MALGGRRIPTFPYHHPVTLPVPGAVAAEEPDPPRVPLLKDVCFGPGSVGPGQDFGDRADTTADKFPGCRALPTTARAAYVPRG